MNDPKTPEHSSFSVCAVMREPLFVVACFVRHYTALGAEKVIILWDGLPEPDLKADLEALAPADKLTLVYCDAAFWAGIGVDKAEVALDDILNAGFTYGHSICESDWILFCDADELLHAPSPVSALLARVPADVPSLRVRNLEAVWGPEDDITEAFGCSYFRAAIEIPRLTRVLCWLMLGRYAVFSRGGMIGHFSGKHFLRAGLGNVAITSHSSSINGQRVGTWAHFLPEPQDAFFFAHYDAISEERWVEKWRRRISAERISDKMSPQRARQQELVEKAIAENTTAALFKRLYGLTGLQTFILTRLGLLSRARPIQQGN